MVATVAPFGLVCAFGRPWCGNRPKTARQKPLGQALVLKPGVPCPLGVFWGAQPFLPQFLLYLVSRLSHAWFVASCQGGAAGHKGLQTLPSARTAACRGMIWAARSPPMGAMESRKKHSKDAQNNPQTYNAQCTKVFENTLEPVRKVVGTPSTKHQGQASKKGVMATLVFLLRNFEL